MAVGGRLAAAVLALGFAASLGGPAQAQQVLGQVVPPTVEPGQIQKQFEAPKVPMVVDEPVITEGEEAVAPEGAQNIRFVLSGVVIEGSSVYVDYEFIPLYQNLLGVEISLADVYRLAAAISAQYRNDGYILSRAIVPPQKIRDGIVRLQVVEGFVYQVIVEGELAGPQEQLAEYARQIARSRPLHASVLERYLLLTDDLPGVTAKGVLTPSIDQPGASDLVVFVDHDPVNHGASIDNRGTRFLGPYQFQYWFNLNSVLGMYESTRVRYITTAQLEELKFLEITHTQTISDEGTKLIVSGTLSSSEPGFDLGLLQIESDSVSLTVLVSHPFIRSRSTNFSVRGSLHYIDSETDVLGALLFDDRLRVFRVGATYDFIDRFRGVNLFDVEASQGLDFLEESQTGTANLSRANGNSDFFKITGAYSRLQDLRPLAPKLLGQASLSLLAATKMQYSGSPLLSAEEFSVGGKEYGRAYDSSEITGDHGVAAKLEVQYGRALGWPLFQDYQLYTLYDVGTIWRIDPATQTSISSAGLGARFNLTSSISGFFEATVPVTADVDSRGDDGDELRVFFSLATRF